jgi:hypothetical protein
MPTNNVGIFELNPIINEFETLLISFSEGASPTPVPNIIDGEAVVSTNLPKATELVDPAITWLPKAKENAPLASEPKPPANDPSAVAKDDMPITLEWLPDAFEFSSHCTHCCAETPKLIVILYYLIFHFFIF